MAQLVITAVGSDRPGLVGELTGALLRENVNVADSRMVNLRGQFAMLVLAEGPTDALERLRASLPQTAQGLGLTLTLTDHRAGEPAARGLAYRLKTYSTDQPGIVHRVAQLLQSHGINIESLETRQESGAFSGAPLFTMEVVMTVPQRVQVRALRTGLEVLCEALNCDVDLDPA